MKSFSKIQGQTLLLVMEEGLSLRLYSRCLIFEVQEAQIWGYSSAGRAPALQAGGHRFDPDYLHHMGL